MKLIVGLGNPERKYEKTRHNIGFRVIDNYLGNVNWQNDFYGWFTEINKNNEKIFFLKPKTYMNASGLAVSEIVKYYKINIDDILVIQDDFDVDFGKYKLKRNSSSGGHNGINSIITALGTNAFSRLKIGIRRDQRFKAIEFVLGKLTDEEIAKLDEMQTIFNEIIDSFITDGIERTMNIYNTK